MTVEQYRWANSVYQNRSEACAIMDNDNHRGSRIRQNSDPATAAIKWGAIVIIVGVIIYFLARYIVPLLPGA